MEFTRQRIIDAHEKDQFATIVLLAREWLTKNPVDSHVIYLLSQAFFCLARYDDAISLVEVSLRRFEEPVEQQILTSLMGEIHEWQGDLDQAESWYRRAISAEPNHASGYMYLGQILAKRGKLHEAEEIHRKGAACKTGCVNKSLFYLGLVLRGQGRVREAAKYLREAIEIDPEYKDAMCALNDVETAIQLGNNLGSSD